MAPGAKAGSGRGAAPRRRVPGRCALALCASVCALALWSPPALALIHRGHVFGFTFEGTGEHRLDDPGGVAVNEETGEVYVVDRGNERVERFKPNGAGHYVFASEFDVAEPEAIAVDNSLGSPSHGDVYVVGAQKAPKKDEEPELRNFIYKFTGAGVKIYKKSEFQTTGGEPYALEDISGVSVDANGTLWVYWEEEGDISGFTDDEKNKLIPSLEKEPEVVAKFECRALPGLAVSPADEYFYLRHERGNGLEECPEEGLAPSLVAGSLVGKSDGAGNALATGLDDENTTGVAVNDLASSPSSGDVYAENTNSVAAFTSGGAFIQRFGTGSLSGGSGIAVDAESEDVFVAEAADDEVVVFTPEEAGQAPVVNSVYAQDLTPTSTRLIARIDPRGADTHYYFEYGTANCVSEPSLCTDIPSPPGADLGSGFADQTAEVQLEGLQPDTTYDYLVVAQNEHGSDEVFQAAETFFTTLPTSEGLLPNHREWEMATPPKKGGLIQALSLYGADIQASEDGRSITYGAESSGPIGNPEGNRSIAPTQFLSTRAEGAWSTQDIATPNNKGLGLEPPARPEYRAFSPDLSLSIVEPEIKIEEPLEQPPLSPPLSEGELGHQEKTIYLRDNPPNPPIAPGSEEKAGYEEAEKNREYLAPGYLALVTGADDTAGSAFGKGLEFSDATAALNHVVVESKAPLTKNAVGEGLYEWNSESPQQALALVSVLPGAGEVPAGEPRLGAVADTRNAISSDGSRIFWTNEVEAGLAFLYMRDTSTDPPETVQINGAQGVSEPSPEQREEALDEARFQTASSDGSRVFFKDTWPLTPESKLDPSTHINAAGEEDRPADLDEYDVETGTLSDLTVDQQAGEGAAVLGTIPGSSEDGSYVYFVADGVLAPGATPGDCPLEKLKGKPAPGLTCNLYVSEVEPEDPSSRQTRFIATLSAEDAPDWGAGHDAIPEGIQAGDLTFLTSRVSPDGRYLAFMSNRSLTGYDNEDVTSRVSGERLDEEVFLYDAKDGRLVCASCNPSGARPHGVLDTEDSGEGDGLLVDRPKAWNEHWLAGSIPGWTASYLESAVYQSRYLLDSGRLFLDSADALVPQDKNHKEDVYEYEPEGAGSCRSSGGCVALISSGSASDEHESAFLDASASGNDVFFLTSEKLVASDIDTTFDIYDARVCGTPESEPCLPSSPPPPAECKGEECKLPSPGPPVFSTPETATFAGPGNRVAHGVLPSQTKGAAKPTRPQELAKALKACKKIKKKKKRAACESQARKKYGPKSTAKKSKKKTASPSRRGT
jgi:DNA-binding beta-propeller fold protein YncE